MENETNRLEVFVNQLITNNSVWLLQADEGLFAMVEDNDGKSYVTVWPSEAECKLAAQGEWFDYQAEAMDMKEFMSWLYELEEDDVWIGVYPDTDGRIMPFRATELSKLLAKTFSEKK
jgi:hypothetical protein